MTVAQKIKRLSAVLEQAELQHGKAAGSPDFIVWRDHATNTVASIFGVQSLQAAQFFKLTFTFERGTRVRGVDYSSGDRERRQQAFSRDLQIAIGSLKQHIADLQSELEDSSEAPTLAPNQTKLALAHLHPAAQAAVGSRFVDGYYSDALHKACTALEKAVQHKANQPAEPTGAKLMGKVFSKDKAVLTVSANQGEQEGYMFLYMGLVQAIRNHYAHNDPATDPARALEWLGFISALFYKLEAGVLSSPIL